MVITPVMAFGGNYYLDFELDVFFFAVLLERELGGLFRVFSTLTKLIPP